ncbi:LysR substrate-binding domain-containing protein [Neorhizobium sp. CSC1952]|uniref:LysR family transcriptional regulator n=1 Tax=Neorhizobium sp. CSC1952 TaxID=2978974 RepID=UPI0025A61786|nr:LysR family transcriptional regulator [Rhizobium sp. CSC1952]WJR65829.1 LysR substrate-binding domain-containing protein [Rhizobium sp. CSC1952]
MNRFQDILSFVRVAELGGFTAAAKALSSSTSAVTKSVTRLEEGLGVQLLHRTTRRMHLTEYGAEYYERCRQILIDLDEAEGSIREANIAPSGQVRIALPPSFGRMTVIPALPEFYERYPNVVLDLCLKSQTANPIEGGFDLVVHSGRLADSRLINRILVRGAQKTVAAPSYIERYGKPETPADLDRHNCIVGAFGPNWHFRGVDGGDEVIRVSGCLTTDSGDILREAAMTGLGISQATWWLFRDEMRRGLLVPLLEEYEIEADPIAIVFPANRRTPAKVRAVVDFLLKITRSSAA